MWQGSPSRSNRGGIVTYVNTGAAGPTAHKKTGPPREGAALSERFFLLPCLYADFLVSCVTADNQFDRFSQDVRVAV